MKSENDIQFAHDLLVGIILGESPLEFNPDDLERIKCAADVLCWVLGHDHNKRFAANLQRIVEEAEAAGGTLVAVGHLEP